MPTKTIIVWTEGLQEDLWDLHVEHPGWSTRKLAEEMGLPWKAVENCLYRLKCVREDHWLDNAKVGFFDIESTDLKANVGFMLCWGLLHTDGTVVSDVITRREIMSTAIEPDKRVVASCLKAIEGVDVLVTYNGERFDIPFLRSRAMVHGLRFPAYGQKQHIDLYWATRRLTKLTNNRMGTLSAFLGGTDKDSYDVRVWNRARRGDGEALGHIYSHNISDLQITQERFIALGPYMKWTRKSI